MQKIEIETKWKWKYKFKIAKKKLKIVKMASQINPKIIPQSMKKVQKSTKKNKVKMIKKVRVEKEKIKDLHLKSKIRQNPDCLDDVLGFFGSL